MFDSFTATKIHDAAGEFETVLKAELNRWDTYFASQKGAFSTPDLIEQAENLLPEVAKNMLTEEALADIRQAGRCLAFNLGTASSFHAVRVTESFIWMYYKSVIGSLPPVKMRNWGSYATNLEKCGKASTKIIGWLRHLKDEYRNPVLHPDEIVTPENAQEFLTACSSLIGLIASEIARIDVEALHLSEVKS